MAIHKPCTHELSHWRGGQNAAFQGPQVSVTECKRSDRRLKCEKQTNPCFHALLEQEKIDYFYFQIISFLTIDLYQNEQNSI